MWKNCPLYFGMCFGLSIVYETKNLIPPYLPLPIGKTNFYWSTTGETTQFSLSLTFSHWMTDSQEIKVGHQKRLREEIVAYLEEYFEESGKSKPEDLELYIQNQIENILFRMYEDCSTIDEEDNPETLPGDYYRGVISYGTVYSDYNWEEVEEKQEKTDLRDPSGYTLFFRDGLKGLNNLAGSDSLKQIVQSWRNLSQEEKDSYKIHPIVIEQN